MNLKNVIGGIVLLMAVTLAVALSYVAGRMKFNDAQPDMAIGTSPMIAEVKKIAELAMLNVRVADVLEARQGGWLRWVKGAWVVKGDALIGVDLTKAVINVDETRKQMSLQLPVPTVLQARVDHQKTKTYDVQRGLCAGRERESNLRDAAMRQAQQSVEVAANTPDNIHAARRRLEKLLRKACKSRGWTATITWVDACPSNSSAAVVGSAAAQ